MSEELIQVLRMLSEGKITVDDAHRLLEALNGPHAFRPAPNPEPHGDPHPEPSPIPAAHADSRYTQTGHGKRLDLQQLSALRAMGVTAGYVQELRDVGLTDLTADMLRSMRAVGVDADYIQSMREAGLQNLDLNVLVNMRAVGVTPEWIHEMQQVGISDLNADTLITLRATGVDAAYIREMGELDLLVEEVGAEAER